MDTNEPHKTSQARIDANRRNAQKSTGPRTAEGKLAASRNSLKHGLRAEKHFFPDENMEDFEALLQDLQNQFQPVGESQEALVLRLAVLQWRLSRVFSLEAGIYHERYRDLNITDEIRQLQYEYNKADAEEHGEPAPPPFQKSLDSDRPARAFALECRTGDAFTKLSRYEASLERSVDRTLRQLKSLQSVRPKPSPSPHADDPNQPTTPTKQQNYQTNPTPGPASATTPNLQAPAIAEIAGTPSGACSGGVRPPHRGTARLGGDADCGRRAPGNHAIRRGLR